MSETRDKTKFLSEEIKKLCDRPLSIMEVCGTHTMSLAKHAIRSMLPENLNVISGPGCPVCVTAAGDIQAAIDLVHRPNTIVATFGDMLKVPTNGDTLQNHKNVLVIYSPLDALEYAMDNPDDEVVLLGIGFETTAPLIAATILAAQAQNVSNFSVLSMHKTVPVALKVICSAEDNQIDGLILPGHVSAITGRKYFDFIKPLNVSGVVAGFEPLDIMECLYLLVKNIVANETVVLNNYQRLVTEEGNTTAMKNLYKVFEASDANWRGIGTIPDSGLSIKEEYSNFDAVKKFELTIPEIDDAPGCLCGQILMGKKKPFDCGYFGTKCNPTNPIGPCMVSSEGTCAAFYKYGR